MASDQDWYSYQIEQQKQDAISSAATIAYNKAMAQSRNNEVAYQAAQAAANQALQLINTYGGQAISALNQAGQLGLGVADLLSKLQGPANAFAYDRAVNGLQSTGLSNSIGALTGSYHPPAFQQMGATTPMTLGAMNQQLSGGANTGNAMSGGSIIDQLLGIAHHDTGMQGAVEGGWLPWQIPQFNSSGTMTSGGGASGAPAGSATGGFTLTPATSTSPMPTPSTGGLTGATSTMGSPTGYSQQAQSYLNALPNPNQVNAKNYNQLDPYSQAIVQSGYAAKGYDPNQLTTMWAKMLPGQSAGPRFGMAS